jgi:hypothetical protein
LHLVSLALAGIVHRIILVSVPVLTCMTTTVLYLADTEGLYGGAPALDKGPVFEGAQVAGAPVWIHEHQLAAGQATAAVHRPRHTATSFPADMNTFSFIQYTYINR